MASRAPSVMPLRRRRRTTSLVVRLVGASSCLAVVALTVGVMGALGSHRQVQDLDQLKDRALALQSTVNEVALANSQGTTHALVMQYVPGGEDDLDLLLESDARRTAAVGRLPDLTSGADRSLAQDIARRAATMDEQGPQILNATDEASRQQAQSSYDEASAAFDQSVVALQESADRAVQETVEASRERTRGAALVTLLLLVVGLGLSAVVITVVARRVRHDTAALARVARAIDDGDLTAASGIDRDDELGRTAAALDHALTRLRGEIGAVAGGASTLERAAADLDQAATRAAGASEQATSRAQVVGADIKNVMTNLQAVAAGSDEMGSAIREIAASATEASGVAAQAVSAAESTTVKVARLGESSNQIGDIVRVITAIAEQTNLLALNATIEAARAGEMGKGFAVVAGEVKELAQQTARATEDISQRVSSIQSDTSGAVSAITSITEIVVRINDLQATIASAVEEQTATTTEMSRSIAEAALGADRIMTGIDAVTSATSSTDRSVSATHSTARALQVITGELRDVVGRFTL